MIDSSGRLLASTLKKHTPFQSPGGGGGGGGGAWNSVLKHSKTLFLIWVDSLIGPSELLLVVSPSSCRVSVLLVGLEKS